MQRSPLNASNILGPGFESLHVLLESLQVILDLPFNHFANVLSLFCLALSSKLLGLSNCLQ
jgi:hypothetical protein